MNDWNLWNNSQETRLAIQLLETKKKTLQLSIADGYLLLHDRVDKIAVDYAHKVGVLEGLSAAINYLSNMSEELEEEYSKDGGKVDDRV